MASIPANTKVFDVIAYATPEDYFNGTGETIASIWNTTNFTTSKFADETLFFKHQWMEED